MNTTALQDPHLLVVDDDERLRALLQRYLSSNGFRVSAAAERGRRPRPDEKHGLRSSDPGRDDARRIRARADEIGARELVRADPDADRQGRGRGPHQGFGKRRRRLSAQAVRAARAAASPQRAVAPRRSAGREGHRRGAYGRRRLRSRARPAAAQRQAGAPDQFGKPLCCSFSPPMPGAPFRAPICARAWACRWSARSTCR